MLQYEPLAATVCCSCWAPYMEGSGAAYVEGREKQGNVGEWCGRAPPMCGVGAGASIAAGASVRTRGPSGRAGTSAAIYILL
jgi:hypothetical protein